jgi:adenylate cyclase
MSRAATSRRRGCAFLNAALATPKLSAVMAMLFVSLSLPILVFILVYHYHRTSAAILATLREEVAKTRVATIDSAQHLLQPVASTLRLLAEVVAVDPAFFRTEQSREVLYRALTAAEQIDAIYTSFEDGYHRVVTRMDDRRRRSDPQIPWNAHWHSSYIDAFAAGTNRRRHRTFFDTWPHVVGEYAVETAHDVRTLPHYQDAKATGSLVVTELGINPDTGAPVLFIAFPILRDGRFIGFACANITVDILSSFLNRYRASPHSTTTIADRGGAIVAYPEAAKQVQMIAGRLQVATLDSIADADLREAARRRTQRQEDHFLFRSPVTGQELSASFARFPEEFPRPWEAIILTPTDDFVGALKVANRQTVAVIAGLTGLELVLIYALSRRLSRPIEGVSRQLRSLETFSFASLPAPEPRTRVREIAQLQDAVARVRASLRSFARYAPEEIVREVAASGQETTLSADRRAVTALFCDLRGFTTIAEQLGPERVVAMLNAHFEVLAGLVARHDGYVVDFLGDGLFAVFGAPKALEDHAGRAVACAIEMQLAREAQNRAFFTKGWPPLEMGIGINTGLAVVGNMGSDLRTKYGVAGHLVNLAARIESFTVGGQVLVSEATRGALAERLGAEGPLEAEAKGVDMPVRMWMVRRLEGPRALELPSPVSDLVELASTMAVCLRPLRGKQLGAETYPATLVKLGPSGAELDTACPLAMFDAVQVLLPPQTGSLAPLDSKVLTVTEATAGRRTACVRFGGLDWDVRTQLEALSRAGKPEAECETPRPGRH